MRPALVGALLVTAAVACARPLAPPGGERDMTPPRLVATSPEPLTVVPAGDHPVVFFFDERISERNFSESLVTVSPLDSAMRVDRSRSQVRVRIDGGWRPGRIYRVVLLPGVRDLFGNMRTEAVELVFSTGPEIPSTAFAGIVLDRVTAAPARNGVVDATARVGGARYTAMADSSGFFSLRFLPLGAYDVFAYDDQNRNRRLDSLEPVDTGHVIAFDVASDTATLVFNVLSPDTSGPRLVSVAVVDSLHVGVELDDPADPDLFRGVRAEVFALPDSVRYTGGIRTMSETMFTEERRLAADTTGVQARSIETPARRLVIVLDRPLVPGTYSITVTGVVNLHGLVGGGTSRFDVQAPP